MIAVLLLLAIVIVTIIRNKQFLPKNETLTTDYLFQYFWESWHTLIYLIKDWEINFNLILNFNLISVKSDYYVYICSFINFTDYSCASIPLYSRAFQ